MLAPRLLTAVLLCLLLGSGFMFFYLGRDKQARSDLNTQTPESHLAPSDLPLSGSDSHETLQQWSAIEAGIRELANFSSPSERLAFMRLLQDAGQSGTLAVPLLKETLQHPDPDVRRAAMRGLAATQTREAIALLEGFLSDDLAIEESTEAALALATIDDPSVTPLLQGALERSIDFVLREHLVDSLVSRPPAEVSAFVDSFLARPDIVPLEKQNLLRMSGLNNTKPPEFLAAQVHHPEEPLRLGAYQGLALVSESRQSPILLQILASEKDPFHRSLVYEALGNQLDANIPQLGNLADSETDGHAKLRALKAWTESAGRENLPLAGDIGSISRVEELQSIALDHPDFSERREALFALGLVRRDPVARPAIMRIARESTSGKIRNLARGLLANPE
jgi:HEAT repeat protein